MIVCDVAFAQSDYTRKVIDLIAPSRMTSDIYEIGEVSLMLIVF